jgi:predicted fused transcriptional regulator/phosphomethylpyrimidine kinase
MSNKAIKIVVSAAAEGVICRGYPLAIAAITGHTQKTLHMNLRYSKTAVAAITGHTWKILHVDFRYSKDTVAAITGHT